MITILAWIGAGLCIALFLIFLLASCSFAVLDVRNPLPPVGIASAVDNVAGSGEMGGYEAARDGVLPDAESMPPEEIDPARRTWA
jgi:hypothetical protein